MEQSVHKLQSFINDVVNYSRNSRLPAKTESINFKELVASVLDDHRFSPDFNTIQFTIEDLTDGPVTLDSLRLKIVLNNLVSNAIKFRWTGDDRISTVRIILEKIQTGDLRLSVADNGRGIQAQHLGKLFDMFYRATADAPGSGLGLYIVKESVKKMKGEITVQSTPGKGTTFTITLPA
jgi:signal transduction histidine kinase